MWEALGLGRARPIELPLEAGAFCGILAIPMAGRRSWTRLYSVRHSPIHGRGVFALRRIPKGTRLIEYRGERISSDEATRRYDETMDYPFTYLFEVDESTIIDAGVRGNSARHINHSCSPNCESLNDGGRIFIETLRQISPGEELTYDYQLETEEPVTPRLREAFACNCGTRRCRGTLLSVD